MSNGIKWHLHENGWTVILDDFDFATATQQDISQIGCLLATNTCVVARVDDVRTRSVLASVMDAVKASGLQRTSLGRHRKAPIVLTEEAGVRLALALLVTERVTKPRRIDAMLGAINNMAVEEAYYWYSKCMSTEASRVRKALRIFLAEE